MAGPTVSIGLKELELDEASFAWISRVVYDIAGIVLNEEKHQLVKARLAKRMRATGIASAREYIKYVKEDKTGRELRELIDAITTNKTSFFRESDHFDYLRENIIPALLSRSKKMRFWSAGCSTGEEPYTLAITLREELPNIDLLDVKILATDISNRVLAYARNAEYTEDKIHDVPAPILKKYFFAIQREGSVVWRVTDEVRKLIRFARLNLLEEWPMKGPFDVIFCRNVMIYFDRPTRQQLVARFFDYLTSEGYLIVGHSEGLSVSSERLKYVKPGIYKRF
jgi:chemotaxis protein methyltransferase CheR